MTNNDQKIIDLMSSIGFRHTSFSNTGSGSVNYYMYFPDYFEGKHYTLVLFKHAHSDYCEHRLYIHKDTDGSFLGSLYQISASDQSSFDYINEKIKKIFVSEMRVITIQEIIKNE